MSVLTAALLLFSLAACGGTQPTAPQAESSQATSYENGGFTLSVPAEYADLVQVELPNSEVTGMLFTVTEIASMEAAKSRDADNYLGAGFLFGISSVSEEELHELLCWDMSGQRVFARDEQGRYYILNTPTDVRLEREGQISQDDMDLWSKLTGWAGASAPEQFIADNNLTACSFSNTGLDMLLAQIAWEGNTAYTMSSLDHGTFEPAGANGASFAEELLSSTCLETADEEETPDGEYFVLNDTAGNARYDFFQSGDGRYVRETRGDYVWLYHNEKDGNLTEIVSRWYEELVAQGVQKAGPEMLGGWSLAKSAAMTPEAQAAFDNAMEGLVGVSYTPLALLGTQLVSGTNYCILCEAAVIYPDAKPYYAIVTVYEDLQGNGEIRNIVALDLGEIMESGEIENAEASDAQLLGGWTVDRESSVQVDNGVMHLASQVVSGTNHCVLCEGWSLCFVYENTEGNTEVLQTIPLNLAALSQPAET